MIGRWFKKKIDESDKAPNSRALPFHTDLHSHLIPGIDDGAATLQESLELLEGLKELGYRRIYTTPHIMSDSYRNSSDEIMRGLELVRRALEERGWEIEIDAAAEYYLDDLLMDRLKRKDILTIGDRLLLFETSYYNAPLQLEEMIYEMTARGYRPLIAHPERYRYVTKYENFYGRLKTMGVLFQININSLEGFYGKDAKEKALWLKERGWIDYLGSDLHGRRQLKFLKKSLRSEAFRSVFGKNRIRNDAIE